MTKEEKKTLIELICEKQIDMILEKPNSYNSREYNYLEKLKITIKDIKNEELRERK